MKMKTLRHALAMLLVFCMVVSMLPLSALAATLVTPTPTQTTGKTIPVEYFTSTLYNWDQKGANYATAQADYEGSSRQELQMYWSQATIYNNGAAMPANIYFYAQFDVKVGDAYYPAYGKWENGGYTRASLYYKADGNAPAGSYNSPETGGLTYVTTYDVPNINAYITDPTGTFATETVSGQENVVIFYGAAQGGHYEKKGFYFTDGSEIPYVFGTGNDNKDNYPAFSKWQGGAQEYSIYSGLAEKNLSDAENAPFSNENVNAADLFSTTEYGWKQVYQNVKVPYYLGKEGTDDEGYYILDSDKYGVYFTDEGVNAAKDGATMAIADLPSCYWAPGDNTRKEVTGFLPFNPLTSNIHNAAPSTSYVETDRVPSYAIVDKDDPNDSSDDGLDQNQNAVDYGFGMVTEVKFQMTDDGLDANGNPITFEFSGDDDVWVYIDDKLVLDVGGTHDAIRGTINFATGVVELDAPAYDNIGDYAKSDAVTTGGILNQTNLYGENGVFGTTLTGFSAQGEHTMKIFYMERGRGRTNCLIKFNLPQRDTVEVTKKLDKAKDDSGNTSDLSTSELAGFGAREFGFTLYENDGAVANKTYYVYDANNNLLRTASTNAAGHFTLHRNETARFLVDIGNNDSFYVVEDEMTKEDDGFLPPTWTYTTNVADAKVTTDANSFTGMEITATGTYDGTKTDTISFVCENFLSANLPNPGIYPQGERIVIDYGLPITMKVSDLLKNDVIRGEKTVVSLTDNGGVYGTAVYNDVGNDGDYTNDTITYTLNKQLTGIETLTYQIQVTGTGNEGNQGTSETATATANILIMPATSMYYEENFGGPGVATTEGNPYIKYSLVSYSDGDTKWTAQGTANGGNQETGFVGTVGDSTYGSDTVYLTGNGDSYGTSMKASATTKAALFEYDFTGTGTAIYGRVSPDTGYIRVVITDTDKNKIVEEQLINTIEIAKVGDAEVLHNIPIYMNTYLGEYDDDDGNLIGVGNYHVEVMLYKAGTPTKNGGSGADFYLDGIRIYNPVLNNTTVNTAYADDGEANTVVINIRDKITGDNKVGDFFTLSDASGEVIKKDDGSTTLPGGDTSEIDTYAAYGPNNEFYLNNAGSNNKVYTVSFKLINWDAKLYTLYLGMKAPAGNAVVTVGGTDINLNNSTDCYYDISNYVVVTTETDNKGVVHSVGTVTISGKTGLASLTNIKVTGVEEFVLGSSEDFEGNGDEEGNGNNTENTRNVLYMVPRTYTLQAAPEETIPEETVPVFEPGYVNVVDVYVRLLKRATFQVTTSGDVSYITVNGVQVNGTKILNTKIFTYSVGGVKSGTEFEVIAYNSEGVAAEPNIVTVH